MKKKKWFKLPNPEVLYSIELNVLFIFDSFRVYENEIEINLIYGQDKIRLFLLDYNDFIKVGDL